jgi:uncharacterized membrane protein YcaP (DUF421 family)
VDDHRFRHRGRDGGDIGRTAVAGTQSDLTGAVALVVLVAVHRVASLVRLQPVLSKLFDHRVRILVEDGRIRHQELLKCGVTKNDLFTQLRQRGIFSLDHLRYVLYETKGSISVVPDDVPASPEPPLVQVGLEDAAGYP